MVFTCTRPGYNGANFTDMPAIQFVAGPHNSTTATNLASIELIGRDDPNTANDSSSVTIDTSGDADLAAFKVASFSPVVVGQDFTYDITARNGGPWSVPVGQAITVTDVLPADFVLVKAPEPSGSAYWSCQVTQNGAPLTDADYPATSTTAQPITVQCTSTGGLGVGSATPKVTITVHVNLEAAVQNIACVKMADKGANPGWRQDPNSANDCSVPGNVAITDKRADIVVNKSASGDVDAAQPLTYTITVTNNGPDEAGDVVVTDALTSLLNSGGLQSLAITQGAGACNVDGASATYPVNGTSHNIQCTFASLANGETSVIEITVLPVIARTGTRANTATAYSRTVGDSDRDNNTDRVTSTVREVYDLTVDTWATSAGFGMITSAPANSIVLFTTRVTSVGPSSVPDAKVVITLPANAEFLKLDSVGGASCLPAEASLIGTTGQTLTCTWSSDLAAGSYRDITYEVMTPSAVSATVTSRAEVSLITPGVPQNEADLTNNTAQANVNITPASADIQVTLNDNPDPVYLGEETTYTITVRNNGRSLATDVVLDTLIERLTAIYSYQGGLTVSGGGACSTQPSLGDFEGSIACSWASLAVGDSVEITYKMKAESIDSGNQSGSISTTAKVSATEDDNFPANNTAIKASTARRDQLHFSGADLAIVKTTSKPKVVLGETFNYVITVTNNGPDDVTTAQGAQVMDVLPTGISLIAVPTGCTYDDATRTLICLVGNLQNGDQFSVTVPVKATRGNGARIDNTAIVDMPGDTDNSNNQSTASVTSDTLSIPTLSHLGLALLALLMLFTVAIFAEKRRHG
jgi:uncharacterized repeat protein (TIGR01451 family)